MLDGAQRISSFIGIGFSLITQVNTINIGQKNRLNMDIQIYDLDLWLLNVCYTEDEGSNDDRSKLSKEEVVGLLALVSSFRIAATLT